MNTEDLKKLSVKEEARLVTGSSFWETRGCESIGLPKVKLSDGPNGMRVQHKNPSQLGMGSSMPATCFPTASAVACSFDTELGEGIGRRIGEEGAAQGVSMVLGPGLNIKRSPLCGRNFEYFSEDSYLSGKMAAAYVKGIQSTGVTACIKHFAANSRENARMYCDSRVDMQTLRETYLTGFEIAVKEGGAGAVMTAYNKLNGVYCNQNSELIGGILRGQWGFEGVVVSDWGGSHSPVEALKAGADLEMPSCGFSAKEIEQAINSGELERSVLDKSVMRIANFAIKSQSIKREEFDRKEHHAFAKKAAAECAVLLKNEGGVLPVASGERVAIVGDFAKKPRYQGAGSSQVIPTELTNFLSAAKENMCVIGFAQGFKRDGRKSKALIKKAVKLSGKADKVIVCLGLDEQREAEGSDREDLKINENQTELLKALYGAGKKITVLLTCGSAVETGWDSFCHSLLLCHLSGQAGAEAAVELLCGRESPSGRLAETYPVSSGDEPCAGEYNKSPLKTDYKEGIYVGYKYYNALKKEVKYPFGYGLSYTKFEYADFSVTKEGVYVTVKNVGNCSGATVVQVYIEAPRPELKEKISELKLFKKVRLAAGEQRDIFLAFDEYSFRVWSLEKNAFEECGKYIVSLRENARDIIFKSELVLGQTQERICREMTYEEYCNLHISPDEPLPVYEKNTKVNTSMQVADLRYCKGFLAKLLAFVERRTKLSKDKMKSGMMEWLPVRSLMQFMGLGEVQAQGFLLMCDGYFFKGLSKLASRKGKEDEED